MEINNNNWFNRVISVSLVLTAICTFVVVFIGVSLKGIHQENNHLNSFLIASQDIKTNFDESLQAYTENTSEIINYLSALRPENEKEYISFINQVEAVGKEQNLNLDLKTITNPEDGKKKSKDMAHLAYTISFYGTKEDLVGFLSRLEALPYFVKIFDLDFKDPRFEDNVGSDEGRPNITLKIKLFIK